jgi:hypothetical protein
MHPKIFVNIMKRILTKNNMGHIVYINILTAGKTARSIQMNKENFKMKKISSIKMGEVAKKAAKILAKTVGKGLDVGLKVGGTFVLGLGAVGCESTPVVQTQILEGPVVRYYEGEIKPGRPTTYFVVKTGGNPSERHIAILNEIAVNPPYSELYNIGTTVRFRWSDNNERTG